MGERAEDKRLVELKESGAHIYSISKLNTLNTCKYQAYLNYIQKLEGKNVGVYGILGGVTHDRIQGCIEGTNTLDDIKKSIQEELDNLELMGIDFPLDRNGSATIRSNWVANMERFAEEFTIPKGKIDCEKLVFLPIDEDHYLHGYIDAIKYLPGNKAWIIDWKTSSEFKGDHLIEAGRQLVVYAMALEKLGYFVPKVSWVMLKYCETKYEIKDKHYKKVSEWRNLIKDLKSPIEKVMKELGYDDTDIDLYYKEGLKTNHWESFPQDVRDRFKTSIYVRDYELTDEVRKETMEYIHRTMHEYETLGEEKNWTPCNIAQQSFFCATLCQYGGKTGQCKYYVDYCNTYCKEDESEGLFD